MANYPMWHIRFLNARNKLSEASAEMLQASYDEPKLKPYYDKMTKLREKVDNQLQRNYNRGRKEGWLK